jgi:hypothetical protein
MKALLYHNSLPARYCASFLFIFIFINPIFGNNFRRDCFKTISSSSAPVSLLSYSTFEKGGPTADLTIFLDFLAKNVSVLGAGDGQIDLTPSGGVPPYTYSWNNGAIVEDLTGVVAGVYTVSVTDAVGATAIGSVELFTSVSAKVVWDEIPADIMVDFAQDAYEKKYDDPALSMTSCNVLASGQKGFVEFKLLDDVKANGDWYYVGLFDAAKPISAIEQANFLVGIRSDDIEPGQSVLVLEHGSINYKETVGEKGEVYRIESNGSQVSFSKGGEVIYVSTADPSSINLKVVLFVYRTGQDFLNLVEVNSSFACTNQLYLRHTAEDVTSNGPGKLQLIPQGGVPPYYYSWESPQYQGNALADLGAGIYRVTVSDFVGHAALAEYRIYDMRDVEWSRQEQGVGGVVFDQQTGTFSVDPSITEDAKKVLHGVNMVPLPNNCKLSFLLKEDITAGSGKDFTVGFRPTIGLDDMAGVHGFYGFRIDESGVAITKDMAAVDGSQLTLPSDIVMNHSGYLYEVEVYNGNLLFYKNKKLIHKDLLPENMEWFQTDAFLASTGTGVAMTPQTSAAAYAPSAIYTLPKKRLDGGFVIVDNCYLRFKYVEEYSTTATNNHQLSYTILKDDNTPFTGTGGSGNLNKVYGTNWYELQVPQLTHQKYYILKFTGNKEQTYYIRFQFLTPGVSPCPAISGT